MLRKPVVAGIVESSKCVLEVYLDLSVQGSLPRAAGLNEGLAQVMLVVTGSRRGRTRRLC